MAEKSDEGAVGKYLGAPIGGALTALLTWATAGWTGALTPALVSLLAVAGGVCGLVWTLLYRRYLGILGANRRVAAERQAYDALRSSLAQGNMAARLYAERLTRFLDWVDWIFGDAGMADRTLFPHAFGLRARAPLWTARALDRCLLFALVYPVATIFIIWVISGHVGPAESALQLPSDLAGWKRSVEAAGVGLSMLSIWRSLQARGLPAYLWLIIAAICYYSLSLHDIFYALILLAAVPVAWHFGFIQGRTSTGEFIRVGTGAGAVAGTIAGASFFAVAKPVFDTENAVTSTFFWFSLASVFVLVGFALNVINNRAVVHRLDGVFLSLVTPALFLACLGAAGLLPGFEGWVIASPILLFLGLLTVLNAPFDWASLGLTRALQRRGLELGGWWPYALAVVDACFAAVIIAALAVTMVVGVQAFDALAVHGGGALVLPLERLFKGIAANPAAPEYWWIYALLLSTMIPSLVNLIIGGTSLVRGLPGVPSLLLRYVPERGGVLRWDRHWIATVLTAQVAAGAALGVAAQAFLVVVIIGYIMPFIGLELLDMAREVATFNLPARVGQLFGVNL